MGRPKMRNLCGTLSALNTTKRRSMSALSGGSQVGKRVWFQASFQSRRHRYVMLQYAITSFTQPSCAAACTERRGPPWCSENIECFSQPGPLSLSPFSVQP